MRFRAARQRLISSRLSAAAPRREAAHFGRFDVLPTRASATRLSASWLNTSSSELPRHALLATIAAVLSHLRRLRRLPPPRFGRAHHLQRRRPLRANHDQHRARGDQRNRLRGLRACTNTTTRRGERRVRRRRRRDMGGDEPRRLDQRRHDAVRSQLRRADLQHRLRRAVRVVDGGGRRLQRAVHRVRRRPRQVQRAEVPDGVPRHAERREPERAVQPVLGDLVCYGDFYACSALFPKHASFISPPPPPSLPPPPASPPAPPPSPPAPPDAPPAPNAASARAERAAGAAAVAPSPKPPPSPPPAPAAPPPPQPPYRSVGAGSLRSRTCTRSKKRGKAARTSPRSSSSPPPARGRT